MDFSHCVFEDKPELHPDDNSNIDFLHRVFEDELELQLDDNYNVVIGDTVFTPVSILRADSQAYREEFSKWRNDRWFPDQKERLESILSTHRNKKRFDDLCATLKNGQLIPFVGSGMSVPYGLLPWSKFLRNIRPDSSMPEQVLEDLLAHCEYEEAAERLATTMPNRLFDERIEHDLRIDKPDMICGAVVFLPALFDKLVLTTNLDDLLEQMYKLRKLSFSHVLVGDNIKEYRQIKAISERVLLKFHGDCRSREGRVLGKTEYEKAYCSDSPIREELKTIYRNHSILYLGCSLGHDRTVRLLEEVANSDSNMPKHYAFLKLPNNTDTLQLREHFLTSCDVFPIWYTDDHDESIQALFVGMMQYLGKI